jgi:hypothetical protein
MCFFGSREVNTENMETPYMELRYATPICKLYIDMYIYMYIYIYMCVCVYINMYIYGCKNPICKQEFIFRPISLWIASVLGQ